MSTMYTYVCGSLSGVQGLIYRFSYKQPLEGTATPFCLLKIIPPQHRMVPDPRLLGTLSVPVWDSDLGLIMYYVLAVFNGVAEYEI